ncbi:DUF5615 family PIN-like protein, partial [Longimonas sp.]|uniref:DUF5615 family PIN-like protein n=1 Tax=Longimonas sp. TaxID=2039626 RepID=UPI003975498F
LRAASDQEHLASAAAEGWVVFTQDADFLRLHAEGFSRAGIAYALSRRRSAKSFVA